MLNTSYNISLRLRESLTKIEQQRRELLLTPISPKKELQLKWSSGLNRIYYSLSLAGNPLKKQEMVKLIAAQSKKRLKKHEQEVLKYKNALDYIRQNWLVSNARVTPKTILSLYDIACFGRLTLPIANLQQLLDYVQARPEQPIIQAGIINIETIKMRPFNDGNGRITRLLTLLFLYKYGYDFKDLLVLDKYWAENRLSFEENFRIVQRASSITLWLEYFANSIIISLSEILTRIKEPITLPELPVSFWELNDRQKAILSFLEEPGVKITNKKVQKRFKISQITASRDLAKLKALSLLSAFGKGRSIYYIKA